ncbi:MAG: pilus assembly PilX N-terminal domain-containing protein [Candidatus Omnitrophica bacterium]|nr:pilus assembly PilX N-terminal domain-containing protein [Candidatus Omnitrophota bacterium]
MLNLKMRILKKIKKDQKGVVLAIVLGVVALMTMSTLSLSVMIQQDIRLIQSVKEKEQARYMAEAGINHAFARIKDQGYQARSNFSDALDTGSYNVTFSTVGGRNLVTSVGTSGSVSDTVSVEISDNTPSALDYFSGAGNDIMINSLVANARINGNIHANHDVNLKAGFLVSWLRVNGTVSATNVVKEGTRYNQSDMWDSHVVINGQANDSATVYENMPRIVFPTFDFDAYKQAAIDSGSYYSSSTSFSGQTLNPSDGIVYVDGTATFTRSCSVYGGIVADKIVVAGTLSQYKSGTRNVIISRVGDIQVAGRLYTQEALVFASQDIVSIQVLSDLEINGLMLARRNIDMWNVLTNISYDYVRVTPGDMTDEAGAKPFRVISWNR